MKDDAIDLSAFMPQDTTEFEVMKPGGVEGTGWKITLAGPSHPKTIAWANDAAKKNLRKQAQIEQAQVNGRKFKSEDRDPAEVRRENVEWAVNRIVGWTPVKIGSETFVFSDAVALDLLSRPAMGWAFAQIAEAIADERSFTKASATA